MDDRTDHLDLPLPHPEHLMIEDVARLRSIGLAQGGSLANAVVVDGPMILNPGGLRRADEFVRHKILDFVGDMAMLSLPLQGRFKVACSGHGLNNEFLRLAVDTRALRVEDATAGSLSLRPEKKRRPVASPLAMPAFAG